MAPGSRPTSGPSCASPHRTTPFGLSLPHNTHRTAAHFGAANQQRELGSPVNIRLPTYGRVPRLATLTNRHVDPPPYETRNQPQRPWEVIRSPARRVWYFLSDVFCMCARVREKTDGIPVTVCGLHVQWTTWHPATRHSTHRVASRTQSCGIMSLVECSLHVKLLIQNFLNCRCVWRH